MVHSISKEELLEAGCLHAGKLDEAFALYRSAFISANNESDMLVFIRRLYSVNEGAVSNSRKSSLFHGCFQHFILLIKKRCCGETMI